MDEHFFGVCPSFWSWKLPSFLILGSKCVEYFVPVLVWGVITTCLQWSGLPGQGECDGKLDNLRNFQQSFWFTHDDLKKYLPNFSKLNGVQNKVRLVWYCPEFSVGPHQFQITRWLTFNAQLLLISPPFSPPKAVLMTNKPKVVVSKLAETFSTIWRGRPLACKSLNYYGDQRKRGSKKLLKSLDESLVI